MDHDIQPETAAETPVAAPKPLQTAEEIALTSHLAAVKLPGADEDGEAGGEADSELDVKLPKTLKATLLLIEEMQDCRPKDAQEEKAKAQALAKLAAHAHSLSQGPAHPVILGKNHSNLTAAHSSHAEELHLILLSRTDQIVADRLKSDAATIKKLTEDLKSAEAKIYELSPK